MKPALPVLFFERIDCEVGGARKKPAFARNRSQEKMSGTGFWPLALNLAGGSVEYKPLSEIMAAAVNESFHFSAPSKAADGVCVTE